MTETISCCVNGTTYGLEVWQALLCLYLLTSYVVASITLIASNCNKHNDLLGPYGSFNSSDVVIDGLLWLGAPLWIPCYIPGAACVIASRIVGRLQRSK